MIRSTDAPVVTMAACALLRDDCVFLPEGTEAERLRSRGFGTSIAGGVRLRFPEALFLQETGRIAVEGISGLAELLMIAVRADPGIAARWAVYRDLRSRGIAARPAPPGFDFIVPPRPDAQGGGSESLVLAVSESDRLDLGMLASSVVGARRARKRLLLGAMDSEGETTWYQVEHIDLTGKAKEPPSGRQAPIDAVHLGDRVIVGDPADIESLEAGGSYGRRVGPLLHLSLVEAAHLLASKRIELRDARGARVGVEALSRAGKVDGARPADLLAVYRLLRERRLVVKTGFKYGAHFRVYRGHPDEEHAPYLVHLVTEQDSPTWAEVARAVRLAHGVRKQMVFAALTGEGTSFFRIERVKA